MIRLSRRRFELNDANGRQSDNEIANGLRQVAQGSATKRTIPFSAGRKPATVPQFGNGLAHVGVLFYKAKMPLLEFEKDDGQQLTSGTMKAIVFGDPEQLPLEEKPIPKAGPSDAIIKVSLTTICGTDIPIVQGEYPVDSGLTIGHEAVGTIHELGARVTGYKVGQRVLVGAITPCGQCEPCLGGHTSQCGGPVGGWRLGNTIDGVQAEYFRVPFAQANPLRFPIILRTKEVILLADIASPVLAPSRAVRRFYMISGRCLR
jgi:hypothetical protein